MVACSIGIPRYRKVVCMSMICSVHVLVATYSEPKVAVSTVVCSFEKKSMTVWLLCIDVAQWLKCAIRPSSALYTLNPKTINHDAQRYWISRFKISTYHRILLWKNKHYCTSKAIEEEDDEDFCSVALHVNGFCICTNRYYTTPYHYHKNFMESRNGSFHGQV